MQLPGKTADGFERHQLRFDLKGSTNCSQTFLHKLATAKKRKWQKRHRATCQIVQDWVGEQVWKDKQYGYIYFAYRAIQAHGRKAA